MNSFTEENYLKAIYKLLEKGNKKVTTNAIAQMVETAPASVTDMLRKLAEKKLIHYEKYQGVSLTAAGKKIAVSIIRKHRLWELFLVDRLEFKWDEVHDIAEQLEHIQSEMLVHKLDQFLGKPRFDPHGDPIPDEHGIFHSRKTFPLTELPVTSTAVMTGVIDHSAKFLQHIEKLGLSIGKEIKLLVHHDYDRSCIITIKNKRSEIHLSNDAAKNILVSDKR
jgi:DtxR family Mn-dependent transcriptional regulator